MSQPLEEHLSSSAVARILGIRTNTLAQMRGRGLGPAGHFRANRRSVLYPKSEVVAYLDRLKKGEAS